MIIEIAVAVIAACCVLIVIRLYALSIRVEEAIRRFEEFIVRMETDIKPVLFDARNFMTDMKVVIETAKHSAKQIDYIVERFAGPAQKFGMFIKAIRVGVSTFLKVKRKERG